MASSSPALPQGLRGPVALAVATITGLSGAIAYWFYRPSLHLRRLPWVPQTSVLGGNLAELLANGETECYTTWARQSEGLVVARVGRRPFILLTDPAHIRTVLDGITTFSARPTLGLPFRPPKNLLWVSGRQWRMLRSATNPAFRANLIHSFAPLMTACAEAVVGHVQRAVDEAGGHIDLHHVLRQMALDVVGSAAFGQRLDTLAGQANDVTNAVEDMIGTQRARNRSWLVRFMASMYQFPVIWLLSLLKFGGVKVRLVEAMDTINATCRKSMQPREKGDESVNLIKLMMDAKDPDTGVRLTDKQILDNARVFLIAGHETTAKTMAFMIYHVALDMRVQDKLFEALKALPDLDRGAVDGCAYLDHVLNESMRMLSVTPVFGRAPVVDTQLGPYAIPAHTTIVIPAHVIHHDPALWGPDADVFRPERFEAVELQGEHRFSFLPFGGGPRKCIGYRFALLEMKITLARLLRKFRFELDTAKTTVPLKTEFFVVVDPVEGVNVVATPR